MQRRRVLLIDAIMRAAAATNEALNLAIELASEGDEVESERPANIVKDPEKTGPRTPFKTDTPPPGSLKPISRRPTAYTHVAITEEKILQHLKKAHADAVDDEERSGILARMRGLVDQGVIKESDLSEYLPTLKR